MEKLFKVLIGSIIAVMLFTMWGLWRTGQIPIRPKLSLIGVSSVHGLYHHGLVKRSPDQHVGLLTIDAHQRKILHSNNVTELATPKSYTEMRRSRLKNPRKKSKKKKSSLGDVRQKSSALLDRKRKPSLTRQFEQDDYYKDGDVRNSKPEAENVTPNPMAASDRKRQTPTSVPVVLSTLIVNNSKRMTTHRYFSTTPNVPGHVTPGHSAEAAIKYRKLVSNVPGHITPGHSTEAVIKYRKLISNGKNSNRYVQPNARFAQNKVKPKKIASRHLQPTRGAQYAVKPAINASRYVQPRARISEKGVNPTENSNKQPNTTFAQNDVKPTKNASQYEQPNAIFSQTGKPTTLLKKTKMVGKLKTRTDKHVLSTAGNEATKTLKPTSVSITTIKPTGNLSTSKISTFRMEEVSNSVKPFWPTSVTMSSYNRFTRATQPGLFTSTVKPYRSRLKIRDSKGESLRMFKRTPKSKVFRRGFRKHKRLK